MDMKLYKNNKLLVILLNQFLLVALQSNGPDVISTASYIQRSDIRGICNGAFDGHSIKDRIDCGYYGISRKQCEQRGCCYDEKYINRYNCFYLKSRSNAQCGFDHPETNRVECGWPGITYTECAQRGCCYDNTLDSQFKHCFYTRTNSNPSCNFANASSLRADCGWYGISYSQCTEQGCCFDAATETHAPGSPHCFCSHNHPYYSEEDRSEGKKRRMQVELTFDGQTFVEICKCISIDVGEDRQKPAINVKCSSLKLELNKSKDKSKMKVIGCTKENPRKAEFGQHIIDSGLYSTVSPQDVGWVMECQYRSSRDIRTCDNFVGNEEIFYEKLLQKIGSEMCQMKPSTHCPRKDYVNDNCKDYPFKFDIFDPESN